MITITIRKPFQYLSLFKVFAEDESASVLGNVITFKDLYSFAPFARLFPTFFRKNRHKYITIKETKNNDETISA